MSSQVSNSFNQITHYLKKAHSYYLKAQTLKLILALFLYVIIVGFLIVLFFGIFGPTRYVRGPIFIGFIVIGLLLILINLIQLNKKGPNIRSIAIQLEHIYPQLNTKLIAGYDLQKELSGSLGYSSALIERAGEKALESLKDIDYHTLSPKKEIHKKIRFIGWASVIIAIISYIFPYQVNQGFGLMMNPFSLYHKPPKTILLVSPGDIKIVKLEDLKITIRTQGEKPDKINLYRKPEGTPPIEFVLKPDSSGIFSYIFKEIRAPFEYYAIGNGFETSKYSVEVVDKPRILSIQATITPPSYTGISPIRLDKNDGNLNMLFGSQATISIRTSKEIESGMLIINDSTQIKLNVNKDNGIVNFVGRRDGYYRIKLVDKEYNTNPDPIEYRIRIYQDEFPVLRVIKPGEDINLNEDMNFDIIFSGEDDYGFSSFYLKYRKADDNSKVSSIKIPFDKLRQKRVDVQYNWNMQSLRLMPNDMVTYWIEGFDNDYISGPKMAKSREYSVRLPSLEEIVQNVSKDYQTQTNDFVKTLEEQKKLAEDMEKFSRELQGREELKWEDKQKGEEIIKKQEELAKQLKDVSKEMQNTIDKLQENALASMEMVQKLQEIQKILEDIATPEMKAAIEQMRKALENMDPNMLRDAMKKMMTNMDELLSKLDQTLNLLKRIQAEQKLENLNKLAQELKEQQDKINEALKSGSLPADSLQKLSEREQSIKNGLDFLEKSLSQLSKEMSEFSDMPSDKMKEAAKTMQDKQLQQHSQNAKNNMQSGNTKSAQKEGQEVSDGLQSLSDFLKESMEGMNVQIKKEILDALKTIISELFYISGNTEDNYTSINPNLFDDTQLSKHAEETNKSNEDLKIVMDELYDIGGKTFLLSLAIGAYMGKAKSSFDETIKRFVARNPLGARSSQLEALGSINATIIELMKSMDNVSSSSSASGMQSFFEQLQKMCQGQGELNAQTIPLMNGGGKSDGMTPEQQAAYSRLAGEQQALQKNLDELQKQYEKYANLQAKFDDVLKDMESVSKDLQQQNANPETVKRQNRILSRMLDAQKSMHQRDFEEKRESKTAKDIVRKGPNQLPSDLGEGNKNLQEQLLRALSEPYPREYDKYIKEYFRKLEEIKQ